MHLPALPSVPTASCPSLAWAGAPRSHLRLLLPAPVVGITPARLQPAVPRTASRGRLEAHAILPPAPPPLQPHSLCHPRGQLTFLSLSFFFSYRLRCKSGAQGWWGREGPCFPLPGAKGTLQPETVLCTFPNLAPALSTPPPQPLLVCRILRQSVTQRLKLCRGGHQGASYLHSALPKGVGKR